MDVILAGTTSQSIATSRQSDLVLIMQGNQDSALTIDSLFLVVFDDKKGQNLIWKRSIEGGAFTWYD
jgi:hypothetical protein